MPIAERSVLHAASLAAFLVSVSAPAAILDVTLGNGPNAVDGSYINAGDIANTMAFTSVTIAADRSVTVAEPIDLSNSFFGPTPFDLFLQAPSITIDGAVKMGGGNLYLNAATLNLNAELQASDGSLLDSLRLLGTGPTSINVNGTGSVQQATTVGSIGLGMPATVNLVGGAHLGESLQAFAGLSATMSGGSVSGATISGGGILDWSGGQILDGVLHFNGIFNIYGAGFQIAPFGDCATTLEANWQAAPTQLVNQARCVRGIFADGSSFRTAVNSIGTTNFVAVSVVPVPAAAWLLASGLALLVGLRRKLSAIR